MNAIKFIKDHGVEKAREVVDSIPVPQVNFYVLDTNTFLELPSGYDPYPYLNANYKVYVSISDLKRLVESVELVELLGGIKSLKGLVDIRNSPFALSHITRDGVIYSIDEIKQAIADYEAIYSEQVK